MSEVTFEVRVQPDLLKFGFNQDKVQRTINEWLVLSYIRMELFHPGKPPNY